MVSLAVWYSQRYVVTLPNGYLVSAPDTPGFGYLVSISILLKYREFSSLFIWVWFSFLLLILVKYLLISNGNFSFPGLHRIPHMAPESSIYFIHAISKMLRV